MVNKNLAVSDLWDMVCKWVTVCAKKYYACFEDKCIRSGVTIDDLIQEGYFATLDAVRAYDPSTGYKFITYMRYPLKNRFNALVGFRINKHEPLNYAQSFDTPIGDDIVLGDTIEDTEASQSFKDVVQAEYIRTLHRALDDTMDCLTDVQRSIIEGEYYKGLTLSQSGQLHGITYNEAKRIHTDAFRKLRHPRNNTMLQEYRNEIIYRHAYHGTGWTNFKYTGISSVERAVMDIEKLERQHSIV